MTSNIDDNNQIADQLQLHEIPSEDSYGLSLSSARKQTAQKIICDHLRRSILARFQQRLKEESDQAGPGSSEQLRYRHYSSNCSPTSGLWMRPSMFSTIQRLSNQEFLAAFCKLMTLENPSIRQKMAKYAQVAQDNGYIFIPAIFSHTGQIHKEVMDLMFKQIKGKLELDDEQVQNSKIMGMRNLWVKQISCVINRTASRNIMAGRAALVEAVNASSKDDRTSTQRDDQLAANSTAAHNFIEDLDLLLINQDHRQH